MERTLPQHCEFDLVDELIGLDPNILDLLPDECKTSEYSNPAVRQAMKEEAIEFNKFMSILAVKEKWDEQEKDDQRVALDLDFDLRETVYKSNIGNCTVSPLLDYANCKTEYRLDLINTINEAKTQSL